MKEISSPHTSPSASKNNEVRSTDLVAGSISSKNSCWLLVVQDHFWILLNRQSG